MEATLAYSELHHRIRNDLALVGSMLAPRAGLDAATRLERAADAVAALGAVYRLQDDELSHGEVCLAEYLLVLLRHLEICRLSPAGIRCRSSLEPGQVPPAFARTTGLIVSELACNAVKHAVPYARDPLVVVVAQRAGSGWSMSVSDNGAGMPKVVRGGRGMSLVRRLAATLDGEARWRSSHSGTTVELILPRPSVVRDELVSVARIGS